MRREGHFSNSGDEKELSNVESPQVIDDNKTLPPSEFPTEKLFGLW
jgi:hypothetical protein